MNIPVFSWSVSCGALWVSRNILIRIVSVKSVSVMIRMVRSLPRFVWMSRVSISETCPRIVTSPISPRIDFISIGRSSKSRPYSTSGLLLLTSDSFRSESFREPALPLPLRPLTPWPPFPAFPESPPVLLPEAAWAVLPPAAPPSPAGTDPPFPAAAFSPSTRVSAISASCILCRRPASRNVSSAFCIVWIARN